VPPKEILPEEDLAAYPSRPPRHLSIKLTTERKPLYDSGKLFLRELDARPERRSLGRK